MSPARIVAFALVTGQLVFAGVIWFLHRQGVMTGRLEGAAADMTQMVALALGFAAIPAGLLLHRARLRQADGLPAAEQPQARLSALLVGMALLEGASLFNLVVWLLTGVPMPNVAAAGLLIVVQLFLIPRA